MADQKPTLTMPAKAEAPKMASVRILYDTWVDGERIVAPAVIDLPMARAKELLAARKAERADPLPGDA